uniref:Uncharacterized protein n=1 Tax=Anguilla anguilla TaxID=7936 RepID=A0A0E9XI23_ANGAN
MNCTRAENQPLRLNENFSFGHTAPMLNGVCFDRTYSD